MTAFCLLTIFVVLGMVYRKVLNNADFIWFTNESLKNKQEYYQAGYATTSMVDIIESSYLSE